MPPANPVKVVEVPLNDVQALPFNEYCKFGVCEYAVALIVNVPLFSLHVAAVLLTVASTPSTVTVNSQVLVMGFPVAGVYVAV